MQIGAEVVYSALADVHVSGHACQEEQKLIFALSKPKFFIPVHGEYRQLKAHAETAKVQSGGGGNYRKNYLKFKFIKVLKISLLNTHYV